VGGSAESRRQSAKTDFGGLVSVPLKTIDEMLPSVLRPENETARIDLIGITQVRVAEAPAALEHWSARGAQNSRLEQGLTSACKARDLMVFITFSRFKRITN